MLRVANGVASFVDYVELYRDRLWQMSDGNLRQIFQQYIPEAHWQSIETLIGRGTPDMNGCLNGTEFWIENKLTSGWAVTFETGQVAWAERRVRAGG